MVHTWSNPKKNPVPFFLAGAPPKFDRKLFILNSTFKSCKNHSGGGGYDQIVSSKPGPEFEGRMTDAGRTIKSTPGKILRFSRGTVIFLA